MGQHNTRKENVNTIVLNGLHLPQHKSVYFILTRLLNIDIDIAIFRQHYIDIVSKLKKMVSTHH